MAWKMLATSALMLLMGCSDPDDAHYAVPGTLVMDRIERRLSQLPCIGPLERWQRNFSFAYAFNDPSSSHIDRNAILFEFTEASRPPYQPRRVLRGTDLDEVAPRTAWGEYHVASDSLFLLTCGDLPLQRSRIEAFVRWRDTP